MFEKSNSQGNRWIEGFVEIEPVQSDFQIVIEASGRNGIISDIAIDDVALLQNADCIKFLKPESATEPVNEESGGIYNIQSCENRCNETQSVRMSSNDNGTVTEDNRIIEKCDCHMGCLDLDTCCPDFKAHCFESKKRYLV